MGQKLKTYIICVTFIFTALTVYGDQKIEIAGTIYVYPENTVSQKYIYLKDIADITCDPDLSKEIGEINLGLSPRVGREKVFTGIRLKTILQSKKGIKQTFEILIPETVLIKKASYKISDDEIRQVFMDFIQSRPVKGRQTVSNIKIRGKKIFPDGVVELAVSERNSIKNYGRVNLYIDVLVDSSKEGSINVSAWVDHYIEAVCATRTLSRGEIITESDIVVKEINLSHSSEYALSDISQVIGKKVTSTVKTGDPVGRKMIATIPIIHKGDAVKLIADNGKLRIVTIGIAQIDGSKGDQVKVMNLTSRKMITGVIIDNKTIAVIF